MHMAVHQLIAKKKKLVYRHPSGRLVCLRRRSFIPRKERRVGGWGWGVTVKKEREREREKVCVCDE